MGGPTRSRNICWTTDHLIGKSLVHQFSLTILGSRLPFTSGGLFVGIERQDQVMRWHTRLGISNL